MAKNMTTTNPHLSTCWHEAGHAVAALVQGLDVIGVTVEPNGDVFGVCHEPTVLAYGGTSKREQKAMARKCIIGSYAGIEAQRLYDPEADEKHSRGDFQQAFEVSRQYALLPRGCSYVGDDVHQSYLFRLRLESRRLVRRHQQQIELLAQSLARRKTLSGEQVRKLLGY